MASLNPQAASAPLRLADLGDVEDKSGAKAHILPRSPRRKGAGQGRRRKVVQEASMPPRMVRPMPPMSGVAFQRVRAHQMLAGIPANGARKIMIWASTVSGR